MASAPTAQTLVSQTRRYLRDWKSFDALTASVSASGTNAVSMTVSDTSFYAPRWPVEVDQELFMVTSLASSTVLLGNRAQLGSTAASHANGASILIRPDYYAIEIVDALNEAIMACFPAIYKAVTDTSQTIQTNTYTYPIADMPGYTGWPIPFVYKVETLFPGDFTFRKTRRFEIVRGTSTSNSTTTTSSSSVSPSIKFRGLPAVGATIRMRGYGPCQPLASINDTLDTLFPPQAWYLLPIYAAGSLLMSGEAGRVRVDAGAVDTREQANRVGSSMSVGMALLNRFRSELMQGAASSAMPPLPRHEASLI